MTVIKLGGCNGSGKTSIARALMKHVGVMEPGYYAAAGRKNPNYYRASYSNADIYVLGNYENVCGGMDTISDKEDRLRLLRRFSQGPGSENRIVFFEGLITGKTYGAMGALSEKQGVGSWLYAFMDTPFEVCVERVLKRRGERMFEKHGAIGYVDGFDPERTMRPTFNSCTRLAEKLRNGELPPHPVFMVGHKLKPETAAMQLLNTALELHSGSLRR